MTKGNTFRYTRPLYLKKHVHNKQDKTITRDHQGSIIALTDSEGRTVETLEYDGHYGKIVKHWEQQEGVTMNIYGYTGRELDAEDLFTTIELGIMTLVCRCL